MSNLSTTLKPKIIKRPLSDVGPVMKFAELPPGPTVLLILDGWGIGPDYPGNAIKLAKTPNMDRLWLTYPHTKLGASGPSVGLPEGVDGNSEVGHTNIGAGSIIMQDLPRINRAIDDGSFAKNPAFLQTFDHVKKNQSALHLLGLVGEGFVHSNVKHLLALLELAKAYGLTKVYVHVITDGRDSPPYVGVKTVARLKEKMAEIGVGEIASVVGRFYAMDRDNRWERVKQAYELLTLGTETCASDVLEAIQSQYDQVTDEYLKPTSVCTQTGKVVIEDNDGVIFFNFRVDRPRELTKAFVLPEGEFDGFERKKLLTNLFFTTMTNYEAGLPVSAVAFEKVKVKDNVGRVLSNYGLRQLRLAEKEKEKMVTYYMDGQNPEGYPGEDWVIFPSKGARSYADVPEMSAYEIGDYLVKQVEAEAYDVVICNLANGDMVGHTGDIQAGIKACEVVDEVVGQVEAAVMKKGGRLLISADHGNVEEMINRQTDETDTKHSTFPVPFIVADKRYQGKPVMLPTGVLADIVPTMLHLLHLPQPPDMTGKNLFTLE